jgi:DNA-binding NarL/FixJ family response regulator
MFNSIRIGLVADRPIFRTGFTEALRASETFAVVAHGETAADAFRLAADATLDILLLEIEIPGIGTDGVKAACSRQAWHQSGSADRHR